MSTLEYCTLFDVGYLMQGLALYESINHHHRDYRLHILALCKRSLSMLKRLNLPNTMLYSVIDVETPALRGMRSTLSNFEYACALKPGFMLRVLRETEYVMYVDADSYFYNTGWHVIGPLRADDSIPVAVTPHRFAPAHERFIVNGNYNAGVIYATRNGTRCLEDWERRCVVNRQGRMTDQRLLNDWPKRWQAHVITHKGLNLAPWNQEQYTYDVRRGGVCFVNTQPVILYHFHQGLGTHYNLAPFVKDYLYKPYREALARAAEKAHS